MEELLAKFCNYKMMIFKRKFVVFNVITESMIAFFMSHYRPAHEYLGCFGFLLIFFVFVFH